MQSDDLTVGRAAPRSTLRWAFATRSSASPVHQHQLFFRRLHVEDTQQREPFTLP